MEEIHRSQASVAMHAACDIQSKSDNLMSSGNQEKHQVKRIIELADVQGK